MIRLLAPGTRHMLIRGQHDENADSNVYACGKREYCQTLTLAK